MFERFKKDPEEKIQDEFQDAARVMGRLLVHAYDEFGDISGVQQTFIYREPNWNVRIVHPKLGEYETPIKGL